MMFTGRSTCSTLLLLIAAVVSGVRQGEVNEINANGDVQKSMKMAQVNNKGELDVLLVKEDNRSLSSPFMKECRCSVGTKDVFEVRAGGANSCMTACDALRSCALGSGLERMKMKSMLGVEAAKAPLRKKFGRSVKPWKACAALSMLYPTETWMWYYRKVGQRGTVVKKAGNLPFKKDVCVLTECYQSKLFGHKTWFHSTCTKKKEKMERTDKTWWVPRYEHYNHGGVKTKHYADSQDKRACKQAGCKARVWFQKGACPAAVAAAPATATATAAWGLLE